MTIIRNTRSNPTAKNGGQEGHGDPETGHQPDAGPGDGDTALRSKQIYSKPVLTRHGKVTDLTLGGSPSTLDLESDGSIGRFGTPKN